MITVADAVTSRRSVRECLDTPVPYATLERVLDQARWAPSGCNYQPWEAVVLTGAPLAALQQVLLAAEPDDPAEYDWAAPASDPKYQARLRGVGKAMYASLAIAREDKETRTDFTRANLVSFGAPVLLLCHFPKFMKEPQWSDVGMWLQTIMLLISAEGLGSCPQEYMGNYGRTIKSHLGLPEDHMLFCGIAIGQIDDQAPVNHFERERIPLKDQVKFLGF